MQIRMNFRFISEFLSPFSHFHFQFFFTRLSYLKFDMFVGLLALWGDVNGKENRYWTLHLKSLPSSLSTRLFFNVISFPRLLLKANTERVICVGRMLIWRDFMAAHLCDLKK